MTKEIVRDEGNIYKLDSKKYIYKDCRGPNTETVCI